MAAVEELRQARWFSGKNREIVGTRTVDRACWVDDSTVEFVEVSYADASSETYVMTDRLEDPPVARALLDAFGGAQVTTESGGRITLQPTHLFKTIARERTEPISVMRGEQSNTSLRYGDALILKLFRRLQFGPNPDVEVGWYLTEHSQFRGTPAVLGSVEYTSPHGQTAAIALLQQFEPNRGDAWTTTLERLGRVLDGDDPRDSIDAVTRLARTTADLHIALAGGQGAFAAEPITPTDVAAWTVTIETEIRTATAALAGRDITVNTTALLERAAAIHDLVGAEKIRHHGDYHLGQVLEREDGSFVIVDFEGEPTRPLAQRREKRSPLRDVAGLLRSLDYARNAALRAGARLDETERLSRANAWYAAARAAFLDAYVERIRRSRPTLLVPDVARPLAALELEKAAYEVLYELNNRPQWLPIPLAAFGAASV